MLDVQAAAQRGDWPAVLDLIGDVLAAHPQSISALAMGINAAQQCGDLDRAIAWLLQLRALQPAQAQFRRMLAMAFNNRAALAVRAERLNAALADLDQALALDPDHVEARYNRGLARYGCRDRIGARVDFSHGARLAPTDPEFAIALAELDLLDGMPDARARIAALAYSPAVRAVLSSARRAALAAEAGDAGQAVAAASEGWAQSDFDLLYRAAQRLVEHDESVAAAELHAGLAARGGRGAQAPSLRACLAQQLSLPSVYRDASDLAARRDGFGRGLAALAAEFDAAGLRRCEASLEQLRWSNFLLAYQGGNDLDLQTLYGDWLGEGVAPFAPGLREPLPPPPRARPRLLLLGSCFRNCTAGEYFAPWVGALRHGGFEVVVAQLGPIFDSGTARIAADADAVLELEGGLDAMAQSLHALAADLVLFPELGADDRLQALASLPLAPRRAMAWGHPSTSGLPGMDAFLSCMAMEPPGGASHYREQLHLLPGLGTAPRRPAAVLQRARAELGLPAGPLYLVPQTSFKIHPDDDAVLAAIAAADPGGTLVLFENPAAGNFPRLRTRLERVLAAAGADPARQLRTLPFGDRAQYLAINAACDVMVDCRHWSGGGTALDALHAGLPIVCQPGPWMRGRQSAAMLGMLGLGDELVCSSPAMLAQRAVALARDTARNRQLRATLRERLPLLHDGAPALAALVEILHALRARPGSHPA